VGFCFGKNGNVMTKARNSFPKSLNYLCLIGVIALGLVAIVGSNSVRTKEPEAPHNVTATAGDEQVTIGWGSVSEATSYNIYWATYSGVSITNCEGKIGDILDAPYSHTGLTNFKTYYYIITAQNDYGESDESQEVSATPPGWPTLNLPDTGQTQSYTDTFGEDSDYTINPPSYTDNDDGTVTDHVTGLIWQQEDDDRERSWDEVCLYCDNLSLAGYSDWRLPSVMELMSIVNYGTYEPAIDTTYFPDIETWANYWSSTSNANNSSYACYVYFSYGQVGSNDKSSTRYVRCVRGGQTAGALTDNNDGTVTDGNIGLMWQQGEAGSMNWENALTCCEDLSLAGYTDWRLPNIKELRSIVDDTLYDPAIDTNYFPDAHATPYWSSTTYAVNSFSAWGVYFRSGRVYSYNKSGTYYVRCVRAVH
jgi:hypothetical protein